jgi:hypothetical protein
MTMTRNGKIVHPMVCPPAYRSAFERLDAALVKNTPCHNAEKIDLLRIALFGDEVRDMIRRERSGAALNPQ